MNEEIRRSRQQVSRRRALSLGGSVTLGGLLAACSDTGGGGSAAASSTSSSGSSSSPSSASTSSSATSASPAASSLVALLDRANTCTMAKEETQGPYWFDVDSIRTDIRENRPGTTLRLAVRVHDMSACSAGGAPTPVPNSVVEIWHCDAGGVYSGFESASTGGTGGLPQGGQGNSGETSDGSYSLGDDEATTTDDGTYLRGAQVADSRGIAQFTTIYPGWYRGRTAHIHLKVHVDKRTVLTSQLYMDEALNEAVYATSPYDERTGRDTTNDTDNIFDESGLLTVQKESNGYLGVINLGVNV
ncbi:MAG TPA: intradiol ring-cleavage dioxygenase [Actinomycetales bacterium]|nr:intradiol ring-cleavage dioxygenase [Actinomycetales bacterium]